MKNLAFLLIITVLLISACRKKTEREVTKIDSFDEFHCYNNYFDEDELGLDCGGTDCEPCQQNSAPCNNPDNQLYLYEGFTFDTKSITSTSIDTTTGNGDWTFYAYTDGSTYQRLEITFNRKPDVTKVYDGTVDGGFLESQEVYIKYRGSYDYEGTGNVYVNYENGGYSIESCDYSFSPYGQNAPQDAQWFNITF